MGIILHGPFIAETVETVFTLFLCKLPAKSIGKCSSVDVFETLGVGQLYPLIYSSWQSRQSNTI